MLAKQWSDLWLFVIFYLDFKFVFDGEILHLNFCLDFLNKISLDNISKMFAAYFWNKMSSSGDDTLMVRSTEESPTSDHNYSVRQSVLTQNRTEAESYSMESLKVPVPTVTPSTANDDNAFQVNSHILNVNFLCYLIVCCLKYSYFILRA